MHWSFTEYQAFFVAQPMSKNIIDISQQNPVTGLLNLSVLFLAWNFTKRIMSSEKRISFFKKMLFKVECFMIVYMGVK